MTEPFIHPERRSQIKINKERQADNWNDGRRSKTRINGQRSSTCSEIKDTKMKLNAFAQDFKLPIDGAKVHISSLRGG